ncbi:cold-shock DNA-binding domain protein [Phenylobacterium zucineum HLK1]|uniref:Cold-shock DNA-binding domain protein n=1 Tax=Phenylobacterium zucineum (strain HLK1) TaxID=450851 RepID=B4RG90_PHEZH|nr:DUF1294 domain-containing protein [Phenylobacterium zucineum]ACG77214.1 cold-shock DNA-binding domain protein [Phenylobacterium zucineum HLK1]
MLLAWIAGASLAAFAAFAADKRAAVRGERRTPETTLLLLAAIGGSPGAIAAQQILRHKTRKEPFRSLLWSVAAAQAAAALWIAVAG